MPCGAAQRTFGSCSYSNKFTPAGTLYAVEVSAEYGVDNREEISFRTYWNQPTCNDKGENCHPLVKDGALLGRTTLKGFRSGDCWITNFAVAASPTPPPIYACANEANGDDGFIAIVLFLRPPTGQLLGELNDLEEKYYRRGGDKAIWRSRTDILNNLVVHGIMISADPANVKWFH